jgi:hypothetical protein
MQLNNIVVGFSPLILFREIIEPGLDSNGNIHSWRHLT